MTAFVSGIEDELGGHLITLLEEQGVRTVRADPDSPRDIQRAVQESDVVYLLDDADGTSGEQFHAMQKANLENPTRLLEHVDSEQRVVLLSSVQVYAPVRRPSQWPITEGYPRRAHGGWPTRAYGQQKIDAENLLARSADQRRYDYVLLRSSVRYGTGQGLAERIRADLLAQPRAAITAYQGLSVMQWVSVQDVASGLLSAGMSPVAAGEAFNIAGNESTTVWDLAELVHGQRIGDRFTAPYDGGRRTPEKFDTAKAQAMLGWTPEEDLCEWLADAGKGGSAVPGWGMRNARGWRPWVDRWWSGTTGGAAQFPIGW